MPTATSTAWSIEPGARRPTLRTAIHGSIDEIDPGQWNALASRGQPLLRHEFLAAMEHGRCVGDGTGWQPQIITLSDARGLAAAAPAYLKSDSFGEFVFDFAWADAYRRYGLEYYPKLTVAVPFTPAGGPRLLVRADLDERTTMIELLGALEAQAAEQNLSSVHALFLDEPARGACEAHGWLSRRDCQFHWINRGYASFEHYLQGFTAEKRKKAHRERRRVREAGIRFETRFGGELDANLLGCIYDFHRDTFLRHGHEPYLTLAFFAEICRTLGESLLVKIAYHGSDPVAAAIFFCCAETLYGRYWGSRGAYDSLHFETCYHQGIEFCIERGIARFEPGTQGEHKVSRGFEPRLTWSAHYIADERFGAAIRDYVGQEGGLIDDYAAQVRAHVPYRKAAR